MSLKYGPASEPLHIPNRNPGSRSLTAITLLWNIADFFGRERSALLSAFSEVQRESSLLTTYCSESTLSS